MANVLIIEDESKTADTLKAYLDLNGHFCKVVYDGYSGLGMALSEPFDVILLDWMLPGVNGMQICQKIKSQLNVSIIMITAKSGENDRVEGLELGADDYVIKPFSLREVLARVNRFVFDANSKSIESLKLLSNNLGKNNILAGNAQLDRDSHTLYCGSENIDLTLTECHMLSILMQSPGRPYLKHDLIPTLKSGQDLEAESHHRVAMHIYNLRRKLTQINCDFTIKTVYGQGYALKFITKTVNTK